MKPNRAVVFFLLLMQSFFVTQRVRAQSTVAGFAGTKGLICVVPERAIVFYDNKLYVAEPGTSVIAKFDNDEAFARIAGRLTHEVQLVRTLSATVAKGSRDMVAVRTPFARDGLDALYYFSPTDDGGITLIEGKKEESSLWRDERLGGRGLPDDSHTEDHALEEPRTGRFILVSKDETVIKGRDGMPLTLHALTLGEKGEKKDAAKFQTIKISGP
jgi:hypothetical protein